MNFVVIRVWQYVVPCIGGTTQGVSNNLPWHRVPIHARKGTTCWTLTFANIGVHLVWEFLCTMHFLKKVVMLVCVQKPFRMEHCIFLKHTLFHLLTRMRMCEKLCIESLTIMCVDRSKGSGKFQATLKIEHINWKRGDVYDMH